MKVRVLKEMPFAKVGEVLHTSGDGTLYIGFREKGRYANISSGSVDTLIKEEWLEEVKEIPDYVTSTLKTCPHCCKSLETKVEVKEESLEGKIEDCGVGTTCPFCVKEIAQIAKDHYLEIFDKYCDKDYPNGLLYPIQQGTLRKKIEEA